MKRLVATLALTVGLAFVGAGSAGATATPDFLITQVNLGTQLVGLPQEYVAITNVTPEDLSPNGLVIEYLKAPASAPTGLYTCDVFPLPAVASGDYTVVKLADIAELAPGQTVYIELSLTNGRGGTLRVVRPATTENEPAMAHDTVGWNRTGQPARCALGQPVAMQGDLIVTRRYHQSAQGVMYVNTQANSEDFVAGQQALDYCANLAGHQVTLPAGYERSDATGECTVLPVDPPVQPTVNTCAGIVFSEIGAYTPQQFIELYNPTKSPIELAGCQLVTNRSATKTYVFGDEELAGGGYGSVVISDTELTLSKTTTGTVYLLSSDGVEQIGVEYAKLKEDTSWAWFGGSNWSQTYAVTMGAENVYQQYLPCNAGYERNEETGRCRLIPVATTPADCGAGKYRNPTTGRCRLLLANTSSLKPCAANQYRNPETNRCRLLSSASSTLKPCAANQYRNPETNRCRLVSSASASLKPCAPGQARNPATNRCRKVAGAMTQAGFAPESVADQQSSRLGWTAFAAVGVLAASYGAWEWRREVAGALAGVAAFFRKG